MNKEILTPTSTLERIQSIDVIRGIAILGIFLVNMPSFYSPILYLNPDTWWSGSLNQWTNRFIDIFAQASFYTLFSFLFGFGLILFKERAIAKGYSFLPLITRRLLILLVIGCIHAFLIWHGDILISYAIVGAIFLLFHRAKPITLLIWSLCLLFIPTLLMAGLLFLATLVDPTVQTYLYDDQMAIQSASVYSSGTFIEITSQRIQDWYYTNNLGNGFFLIMSLLPMFLFGAFIAKSKWFEKTNEHLKKVKILLGLSLLIGVPVKLLPLIAGKTVATDYLQDSIGGPAIAIVYASAIVLLMKHSRLKKIFSPISYVGRLSLSNYLFQSIFCTLLFYNYGLGFYGKIEPFYGLLLTIAIFTIQVILSKIWLRTYRFGPIEWVWRTLTYGQKVPLRKRTN